MGSKLTLKNLENTEFSITHNDGDSATSITSKQLSDTVEEVSGKLSTSSYTVDTVAAMEALTPTYGQSCIVTDLDRGGIFVYDSGLVGSDNQGTNFSGWIRQYSGAVNVKWFGADESLTDNEIYINNAIDLQYSNGGGIVDSPYSLSISSPIIIKNRVILDLNNGGIITQTADNVAIVETDNIANVARFKLLNGQFKYTNQQTLIAGSGLKLYSTGGYTQNWELNNISVSFAYHSYYVADNYSTFLGRMINVTSVNSYNYGYYWGTGTAAHTNIYLENVWAMQIEGNVNSGARGFYFGNIQDLNIQNIAIDRSQSVAVAFQNSYGSVGTIAIEDCTRTSSIGAGLKSSLITVAQSDLVINHLETKANTVTMTSGTDYTHLYLTGGSQVILNHLRDNNTAASLDTGKYYAFANDDVNGGTERAYNLSATSAGTSPVMVPCNQSSSNRKNLTRIYNGVTSVFEFGDVNTTSTIKSIIYKSSAPSVGDWVVGDITYNTLPAASGNIGWVCTVSGAPGTWKTFGTIGA